VLWTQLSCRLGHARQPFGLEGPPRLRWLAVRLRPSRGLKPKTLCRPFPKDSFRHIPKDPQMVSRHPAHPPRGAGRPGARWRSAGAPRRPQGVGPAALPGDTGYCSAIFTGCPTHRVEGQRQDHAVPGGRAWPAVRESLVHPLTVIRRVSASRLSWSSRSAAVAF
jgi:hypothetical protein